MPITVFIPWLLIAWIMFGWLVLRGVPEGVLKDRYKRSGWMQLFLALIAFSLHGETVETAFDGWLKGYPIAFYVKYAALGLWFYLYCRLMCEVSSRGAVCQLNQAVFALILVLGIVSIPLMLEVEGRAVMRDRLIGVRDSLLVVPTLTLFIPATLMLWRRERVVGIKSKQLAIAVGYMLYVLVAIGNILKAMMIDHDPMRIAQIDALFKPVLIPGAIAFLLLLLPYHWLVGFHLPVRLYQFWRLKRLERHVLNRIGAVHEAGNTTWQLFNLQELELAIYRAVINILDYGRLLEDQQETQLQQQVQTIVHKNQPYAELVKSLVRVKP